MKEQLEPACTGAQAVMGKLLKGHLAQQWGLDPASIYHCAVMPCYDKKLEASREDFNLPGVPLSLCIDAPCAHSLPIFLQF